MNYTSCLVIVHGNFSNFHFTNKLTIDSQALVNQIVEHLCGLIEKKNT